MTPGWVFLCSQLAKFTPSAIGLLNVSSLHLTRLEFIPSLTGFFLPSPYAKAGVIPNYQRPYLYPKQEAALFCPERIATIEASTKSGKTVGAIAWIVEEALQGKEGHNYWWVAPGYNQAEIAYRRIKQGLSKGSFTSFDTPTPRIRTIIGTWIWFKSADNPDALYGEDVYAAVIDEASRVGEDSWFAVRSTVTATRGKIRAIGNVKGRKNWFYNLCRKAETGPPGLKYSKITADDAVAAGVLDEEAIDEARRDLPENIFRELYYAEPGDDAGNPFGLDHIAACVRGNLDDNRPNFASGPIVAWGIDLAKKHDYFVCIGLNETGGVVELHRWRGVPWRQSIQRAWKVVGEDTPALVDSTGLGDPVLEELQHDHGNFFGYNFTASSKQKLMEGLAVSIQSHEISFPEGLIKYELELFEYENRPAGVRYSAPAGQHDDCVAALALARQMWTEVAPGNNIMQYYANISGKILAKPPAGDDNRPWRDNAAPSGVVLVNDIMENELESLYNETAIKALNLTYLHCCACGKPISGTTRVSDGVLHWHSECAGPGTRVVVKTSLQQVA